jgi:hypothetical protein
MDSLSSIVAKVLHKHGLKYEAEASLVTHHANTWIADHVPELKESITACALKDDGTLLLECATSVAAQECQQHLPHLALFLKEDCGHSTVRTVRLIRSRQRETSSAPQKSSR